MGSRFQSIMGFRMTPIGGGGGATVALDNLVAVAINASLLPGVDGAIDLGSTTKEWGNLYLKSGGTINWANGDVVMTHSTDKLAFTGAASGYTFDNPVIINTTAALAIGGVTALSEQFGASAAGATEALGMFNATAGTQAEFMFYRSKNASIGSATVVASGDGLGKITWYGAQQTGTFATQNPAAQIRAEVDGTVSSGAGGDMPGRIIFSTTADGAGTLTDRLILDALGTLKPNANDGVALGNTTLMFSDLFLASGAVVNFNNGNMTITHGTATLTIAGGDVILGGGTSASLLKFLEPSASGSNFTAFKAQAQSADITYTLPATIGGAGTSLTDVAGNGTLSWAAAGGGGVMTLIGAASGTTTSAIASNVATFAISGLTALDTLVVYATIESAVAGTASILLYNVTDSVSFTEWTNGSGMSAGDTGVANITLNQAQSANTKIVEHDQCRDTDGNAKGNVVNVVTFTTAWTGSWTLGLRQGGVTPTGTFKYFISVYKLAGQ